MDIDTDGGEKPLKMTVQLGTEVKNWQSLGHSQLSQEAKRGKGGGHTFPLPTFPPSHLGAGCFSVLFSKLEAG